jgi:ABC-type multidrug transport system fused ATPase/permease subunit
MNKTSITLLIFGLLTRKNKRHVFFLFFLVVVCAVFDVLGVASIMPFIAIVSNPEIIAENNILTEVFEFSIKIGIENITEFQLFIGFLLLVLLVISLFLKAFSLFLQLRFINMCEYSLGRRLLNGYLGRPYEWFLDRNSADFIKMILSEVNLVVSSCMMPMLTLVSQSVLVLAMIFLLVAIDTSLALTCFITVGLTYFAIFKISQAFMGRIGKERLDANNQRYSLLVEAFGALKVVKVSGLETSYVHDFAAAAHVFAKHQASASIIPQMPRFALEAVAFGGMLSITLYLMLQYENFEDVIPIVALYALAGYRLLPAAQQIYGSLTQFNYVKPALNALSVELREVEGSPQRVREYQHPQELGFNEAIELKNISYKYPGSHERTISAINLKVPANSKVAFVGSTGSGKTTLVDIILGLLEPHEGVVKIDGNTLTKENMLNWQRCIGYVPQQIYLKDASIAENIAFGISKGDIDMERVVESAKMANVHDFISKELSEKYFTRVGERGVRLSGGQIQRIGIARALYRKPKLMVLDEGTSALDALTEHAIMSEIYDYSPETTIIIIAHRLSTVRQCDRIYMMEKGQIISAGSYEELLNNNTTFQKMVGDLQQPNDMVS